MRRIAVGDVMTRSLVYAPPSATLLECVKKLAKSRIDNLLVIEDKRLVGIVTARDIFWAISKKPEINFDKVKAIDIATRKVAVIKPSADINQALKKMKSLNFRRLPVLSKGEVIGVVTLKDILRIDPTLYSEIGELNSIREEEEKLKKTKMRWPLEGFCDNCSAFSELLRVNNRLLCPECRDELY